MGWMGGHIFLKSEAGQWPIPLKEKKKEQFSKLSSQQCKHKCII
jgi:hypothetical protein